MQDIAEMFDDMEGRVIPELIELIDKVRNERPLRVSTLSKEVGVSSRTTLGFLKFLGAADIKTPSSQIKEPIFASVLRDRLDNNGWCPVPIVGVGP